VLLRVRASPRPLQRVIDRRLTLLGRLEAAGDITPADRGAIATVWDNAHAAAGPDESAYWSLRLVRDLRRALGAPDHPDLEIPLRAAEDKLVRAAVSSFLPG